MCPSLWYSLEKVPWAVKNIYCSAWIEHSVGVYLIYGIIQVRHFSVYVLSGWTICESRVLRLPILTVLRLICIFVHSNIVGCSHVQCSVWHIFAYLSWYFWLKSTLSHVRTVALSVLKFHLSEISFSILSAIMPVFHGKEHSLETRNGQILLFNPIC